MHKHLLALFFALCVHPVSAEVVAIENSPLIVNGAKVGGSVFFKSYLTALATTTVTSAEVYFDTWTISANRLPDSGNCFYVECVAHGAANANSKTISIRVNGTKYPNTSTTTSGAELMARLHVCRVGASEALWHSAIDRATNSVSVSDSGLPTSPVTLDFTSDITVSCTATAAVADDDVRLLWMKGFVQP